MQFIEIEGGIARLVTRTVQQEVTLDSLDKFLTQPTPFTTPLMPRGFRVGHLDAANNHFDMLIEREPRTEHVRLKLLNDYENPDCDCDPDYDHDEDNHRYNIDAFHDMATGYDYPSQIPPVLALPVPWEYYHFAGNLNPINIPNAEPAINLHDAYLYWSPTRLTTLDQPLYRPRLPNINNAGAICWGDQYANESTLATKIDAMVNGFYQYSFNEDWGHFHWPAQLRSLADEEVPISALGIPMYDWDTMGSTTYNDIQHNRNANVPSTVTTTTEGPERWDDDSLRLWLRNQGRLRREILLSALQAYTI